MRNSRLEESTCGIKSGLQKAALKCLPAGGGASTELVLCIHGFHVLRFYQTCTTVEKIRSVPSIPIHPCHHPLDNTVTAYIVFAWFKC